MNGLLGKVNWPTSPQMAHPTKNAPSPKPVTELERLQMRMDQITDDVCKIFFPLKWLTENIWVKSYLRLISLNIHQGSLQDDTVLLDFSDTFKQLKISNFNNSISEERPEVINYLLEEIKI